MDITIIDGPDLKHLCDVLGIPAASRPYRLRIWQAHDGSTAKVKVNEGIWTPALGRADQ